MTTDQPRHLFVYGTLMRASRSPYAKLLQTRAQFVGEAYALGRLYHLGRFPGAVFDETFSGKVHGEVFRLNGPTLLDALDAYEGCGTQTTSPALFYRDLIQVRLTKGGTLCAWSYPFAGNLSGRPLIASGRFRNG